ncbi:hypothetical protein [Agrococcus sp. SGAir0287]|uniref:hypothetical protein n=1 Tax=Agrococcus sp. SGAir0287 TaxID=2070347 RepID=UPI0010CCC80E|nr:hypothetical protein [Agrococcus sp. SGAir0287]QCR20336.1 hypothetical protein C1N71_13535 [Agrococcus sp. SGAir0287]
MTMPAPPLPPLPRAARAGAVRAGVVAGALLGVGLSLMNLAVLVSAVLLSLGLGVGILTIMWGPADDIPVEELVSGVAVPLVVAGLVGLVLLVLGVVASVLLLRRRVPRAGGVAAAACALTTVGTVVVGLVTTTAAWPALQVLGGASNVPWAIALAVVLGLAGALVGAVVHPWVARRMRARWLGVEGAAPR